MATIFAPDIPINLRVSECISTLPVDLQSILSITVNLYNELLHQDKISHLSNLPLDIDLSALRPPTIEIGAWTISRFLGVLANFRRYLQEHGARDSTGTVLNDHWWLGTYSIVALYGCSIGAGWVDEVQTQFRMKLERLRVKQEIAKTEEE